MRRGIVLATVATLGLGLAACGGTAEKAADKMTEGNEAATTDAALTVWVDDNRKEAIEEAAKAYEEATGNKVAVVVKDIVKVKDDFQTQVSNGEGPDITVGAHDWLGAFVANGTVAPLELGDKAADYSEVAVKAFTYDGKGYGLPYAIENIAVIRNAKLADSTPATFEEFVAKGKAANVKYPFLVQLGEEGDPYTAYAFQTSFGAPVFESNENGYTDKLALGGENGVKFAEWLKANGKTGTGLLDTSINYDIAVEAFKNGEAPFIIGGPWMVGDFQKAGIEVAIDPIPSAGGQPAQPFVGVQGFYVSSKSKNALLASQFLTDFVGTKDVQLAIYKAGNRTPALKAAAEEASSDAVTAGFAKVAEGAVPMPSIPAMGTVWGFWGKTEAAIVNGEDPKAAWEKMVSDIQAEIDKLAK
ncbi:ABC transporter, solute-binding protein [Gleimia coleocanis DSM 15436]|uniref:ABC transporter, solute-binding protein n=1 Tax=Gleimia coleocanis DSM 15436 TaxID=525245 RepID=C0W247_9ACTO|nr:extracellular solute-binding protein [Gleimia coleocanis]EEH63261.1 ABC transporter, solute-binding protein [Gleimia coleocanis DSM 15436]